MRQPNRATATERTEALARLREAFPPGSTVYTVLRHRAPSGMSRAIALYAIQPDPEARGGVSVRWMTWSAAVALRETWSERHEAITVRGAGMDMGFHLAYNLSHALYGSGYTCTGADCPSNAHSNGQPRDGSTEHRDGYALRHEWL